MLPPLRPRGLDHDDPRAPAFPVVPFHDGCLMSLDVDLEEFDRAGHIFVAYLGERPHPDRTGNELDTKLVTPALGERRVECGEGIVGRTIEELQYAFVIGKGELQIDISRTLVA